MQTHYYLVHFQYLGLRYHGWLKQPELRTVEYMVEKTLRLVLILGHTRFKILAASRTDARVSANHSAFELFIQEPLDPDQLLTEFNHNLPSDIKVLTIDMKRIKTSILLAAPK